MSTPTNLQQIPATFSGLNLAATECVRKSMELARSLNLIPTKSPLRTIWYAFIKKSLEENGKMPKEAADTYYSALADHIRKNGLTYEYFNIENAAIVYRTQSPRGFGNSVICLEKESYFGVFTNFSDLLGVGVYAGGGQPSLSGTEYYFRSMPDKNDMSLFVISDFDPAGLDIANTFSDQFEVYTSRRGTQLNSKRVGVLPEYYEATELAQSLYLAKDTKKARWNSQYMQDLRNQFGIQADYGLEVESLPADPTPIFNTIFPGFVLNRWRGQARVRLVMLKSLIDEFGVTDFYRYILRHSYSAEDESNSIIKEKSTFDELSKTVNEIKVTLEDISDSVWADLDGDRMNAKNELDAWIQYEINCRAADSSQTHEFTQKVIDRVANDESYMLSEPVNTPVEIFDKIEVSDSKKERVARVTERLKAIYEELEALKEEIEDGSDGLSIRWSE